MHFHRRTERPSRNVGESVLALSPVRNSKTMAIDVLVRSCLFRTVHGTKALQS